MKSTLLFLSALAFFHPLFAADTIAESPTLSENLQLTSFTAIPEKIFSGESLDFSLSIKSTGDSVSSYRASITIQDSSGALSGRLDFFDANIAGGEGQALTKGWSTGTLAPGNYSALANVTEVGGRSQALLATFEILPPAQGAAAGGSKPSPQEGAKNTDDCGTPINCGEWGACDGNYTAQECSYPRCPEKKYYAVQSCAKKQGSQLEEGICSSFPSLCTNQPGQPPIYFCLPIALLAVLVISFALWKGNQSRWQ